MGQEIKIKLSNQLKLIIENNLKLNIHNNIPETIKNVCNNNNNSNSSNNKKSNNEKTSPNQTLPEEDIYINVDDIKWINNNIIKNLNNIYLHDLISEEDIILPQPEVEPRNPILEARIKKLKAQQEDREYRSMTKNVDPVRVRHPEDTISSQIKEINRQLIAVLQFVFSVAAGFTFGFIGIELIVGELEFGFRLLLGVICALIIALAEMYFLAKKLADDIVPPTPLTPAPPESISKTETSTTSKNNSKKGKSHQD